MEKVCERLLEYNIHKERKDWTRFARGKSETFQALDGLVAKGVKVDIGIPNELWHKPSAEITHLKTQCEVRKSLSEIKKIRILILYSIHKLFLPILVYNKILFADYD